MSMFRKRLLAIVVCSVVLTPPLYLCFHQDPPHCFYLGKMDDGSGYWQMSGKVDGRMEFGRCPLHKKVK